MTLIASLAERSVLKFPLFIPHGEPVNVPVLKTNLKFLVHSIWNEILFITNLLTWLYLRSQDRIFVQEETSKKHEPCLIQTTSARKLASIVAFWIPKTTNYTHFKIYLRLFFTFSYKWSLLIIIKHWTRHWDLMVVLYF